MAKNSVLDSNNFYPNTDWSAQKLKLFSYQYVLDSPEAKDRIEIAKTIVLQ
jgi:hypothetical protein